MKKSIHPRVGKTAINFSVLSIHHNNRIIFFNSSPIGPGSYFDVGNAIITHGQEVPTGDHLASLIYCAYCESGVRNVSEFRRIKSLVNESKLLSFNLLTWAGNGVYSINPSKSEIEMRDNNDIARLEEMLKNGKELSWGGIRFSKDGRVRFAPKGSYTSNEYLPPESLAKDGFVIVNCGIEGAEKLAKVSKNLNLKYRITDGDFDDIGDYPQKRCSAMSIHEDKLHILGHIWDDSTHGYTYELLNNS